MSREADIAYAAGLFEGEGSVHVPRVSGAVRMTMTQTDLEPLERLVEILGGYIRGPYVRASRPTNKPWFRWQLSGWDAVDELYVELEPWLSPRRRGQFEASLSHPRRARGGPGGHNAAKSHCAWGHPFDEVNTYITPTAERVCKTCRRDRARAKRAKDPAAYRKYIREYQRLRRASLGAARP
jgi:hypothetical protein